MNSPKRVTTHRCTAAIHQSCGLHRALNNASGWEATCSHRAASRRSAQQPIFRRTRVAPAGRSLVSATGQPRDSVGGHDARHPGIHSGIQPSLGLGLWRHRLDPCRCLGSLCRRRALVHVEAGLRSHQWSMPEEVNRVLTDRLSSLLVCPTDAAFPPGKRRNFPCHLHLLTLRNLGCFEREMSCTTMPCTMVRRGLSPSVVKAESC